MKRQAIIIANTDQEIPGVNNDITLIDEFLRSVSGGAWSENEMVRFVNASRSSLIQHLASIKGNLDYLVIFFTGHGFHDGENTVLQINGSQSINERELSGLCPRQMNIFDCCRKVARVAIEDALLESVNTMSAGLESLSAVYLDATEARLLFNRRVGMAAPQQVTLYSCSKDEYSLDTMRGGLYITALLKKAGEFHRNREPFQTAVNAHIQIANRVSERSRAHENNSQIPDYLAPKIIPDQQLIISINPLRASHNQ